MNIFDYWWIWDWLALEWVEDLGSALIGYVVFCILLVTAAPVHFPLMLVNRKVGLIVLAVLVALSLFIWAATTYEVHGIWNQYQHWYTTPAGPPLGGMQG